MIEYTLTLNDNDLSLINSGLQELPMKYAAPLIIKINKQLTEQQKQDFDNVSSS